MTTLMYKVHTLNGDVLFPTKQMAQAYVSMLIENGNAASLNIWTWQVTIEN